MSLPRRWDFMTKIKSTGINGLGPKFHSLPRTPAGAQMSAVFNHLLLLLIPLLLTQQKPECYTFRRLIWGISRTPAFSVDTFLICKLILTPNYVVLNFNISKHQSHGLWTSNMCIKFDCLSLICLMLIIWPAIRTKGGRGWFPPPPHFDNIHNIINSSHYIFFGL